MRVRWMIAMAGGVLLALAAGPAGASERHFTYTYDSSTLNAGDIELEPWTTYRVGRERHFERLDLRLELELGLTNHLMTAWYWNLSAIAADVEDENGEVIRERGLESGGFSSEWKLKLTDPVADVLGSALYLEGTLAPGEGEVEGKVILDKALGRLLLAANLVAEYERSWEDRGEPADDVEIVGLIAAAWRFDQGAAVGIEVMQANELEGGTELESSVLYAGPTFSYATSGWWTALTVFPQVVAFSGASPGSPLDLERRERLQVRVLIGGRL